MKIENAISMKHFAHRIQRASEAEGINDELGRLDLILSDLESDIAYCELHFPELDSALCESKAELNKLREQWSRERDALLRLSRVIEVLLESAETSPPMACIDDSFEGERESLSAAGRSQLLASHSKTAKENKEKALKAYLEGKRNG